MNFENDQKADEGLEEVDELVDEFEKKAANNLSKEFETFLEATKHNPSQVIRYWPKGMLPLWSGKKYRLKRSDVPECENCGAKMSYELQIMPALYNYVNELVNLNWYSIMVYTCEESCQPTEGLEYVEEYAYVEMIDDTERTVDIQDSQALMDAMKSQKKAVKPPKNSDQPGKGKPKEGPTKSTLDTETEAKIKQQLDELQLDLD